MRGICRGLAGLSLALPLMAASTASAQVCGTNGTLNNLEVLALTGGQQQQLLCFRENSPQNTRVIGTVSGLRQGELLLAIDYRGAADGSLIGLSNQANLYTLNQQTGAATLLTPLTANNQPIQLQGNSFALDENPANAAIRILTSGGPNGPQNFRQPNPSVTPIGPTATDGVLNLIGAPANSQPPQGVSSAAYTNEDRSPLTGTALYGIDTANDTLLLIGVPNAGMASLVGPLGRDLDINTSFDIFSQLNNNGLTVANRAFAVSQAPNQQAVLLEIALDTGAASDPRSFQNGVSVVGLAINPAQAGNPTPMQPGN